jgi:hypothetical protein
MLIVSRHGQLLRVITSIASTASIRTDRRYVNDGQPLILRMPPDILTFLLME